jgi:glycosyltransferase involved in cell wall biosynthesis
VVRKKKPIRVLFVSSRISGTDGVSLEIGKWAEILEGLGAECLYLCGLSDRPSDQTWLIELANFKHPRIQEINSLCFGRVDRTREMTSLIDNTAATIKNGIYDCFNAFAPDIMIAENALTLPMNIPLGIALDHVLAETQIPCIAHHHDFAWERERYVVNAVSDYLSAHFPPRQPELIHVVINSQAQETLSRRTGLSSWVIPNVMDFGRPIVASAEKGAQFRQAIGVGSDETLLLQPTRAVARKGIEHSVELARALDGRRCRLVITHAKEDEGPEYFKHLIRFAQYMDVELTFAGDLVGPDKYNNGDFPYSISDAYQAADLVTFPSTYEGFGNAFLEAVYHRKLIFCNRYTIFQTDIEPLGFEVPMMTGFLNQSVIDEVASLLDDPAKRDSMAECNYQIARKHFSYDRAAEQINQLLTRYLP